MSGERRTTNVRAIQEAMQDWIDKSSGNQRGNDSGVRQKSSSENVSPDATMTPGDQILRKRTQLWNDTMQLIRDFESETGMVVYAIKIERISSTNAGTGECMNRMSGLWIDVRMP